MGKGVKDLTISYNLKNTNPAVLEATRNVIQYYQSQSANSIMARYKAKQKNVSLENIRVSVPNPFLPTTFDPYDKYHNIARTSAFDSNMENCFIAHINGCQTTIDDIGFSHNNNKYVESYWVGLVQKEADDFTSLHNNVVDQQNIFNDIKKAVNETSKKKPTQNAEILNNKIEHLLGEDSWIRTTTVHNRVYDTSRWTISMRDEIVAQAFAEAETMPVDDVNLIKELKFDNQMGLIASVVEDFINKGAVATNDDNFALCQKIIMNGYNPRNTLNPTLFTQPVEIKDDNGNVNTKEFHLLNKKEYLYAKTHAVSPRDFAEMMVNIVDSSIEKKSEHIM